VSVYNSDSKHGLPWGKARVTPEDMSARPRWISLILALSIIAAPLLSACGSTSSHHQATVDLKRRRLQRRRDQVTWVTTFSASQNRELSKLVLDHKAASGPWKLVFQAKDVNLTNPSQAPAAAGVVENNTHSALTSGRMRFAADPKCPNQTKPTPGLYTYRTSSNRLTVTEVGKSDSCSLRAKALTTKTWTRDP
jgi:hypothetical protein